MNKLFLCYAFLAFASLSCSPVSQPVDMTRRCEVIPLDSAGNYAFNIEKIEYYPQLQIYLKSHRFASSIQIKPPTDSAKFVVPGEIVIHGDSRQWAFFQCKNFEEPKWTACWKSLFPSEPLVLGVRFSSGSKLELEREFQRIQKYVEEEVLCKQ